jgi:hypothetical protein
VQALVRFLRAGGCVLVDGDAHDAC